MFLEMAERDVERSDLQKVRALYPSLASDAHQLCCAAMPAAVLCPATRRPSEPPLVRLAQWRVRVANHGSEAERRPWDTSYTRACETHDASLEVSGTTTDTIRSYGTRTA